MTPAGAPLRRASRRRAPRGLTLIEIIVALMIAGVLFSAVVVSIGALTGTKAKAAASELAGVIRSLYDTAALSGKTCRLVFDLPPAKSEGVVSYRAECAAGNITTSRDRDVALKEETRSREELARTGGDTRRNYLRPDDQEPTLQELLAQEKNRVDKAAEFAGFEAEEIAPRELPAGVTLSIWTRHQREAVDAGVAYLYFFPQGFTERAQVVVRQGGNAWTLQVSPLTGKVNIAGEELEVPRS